MASRIATRSLRTSLLRSSAGAAIPRAAIIQRRVPASRVLIQLRFSNGTLPIFSKHSRGLADKAPQPPAERANAIIDSIPGNSLVTKTGTVVLGTGLTAAAISSELYVVNEETVVLVGFLILVTYIGRAVAKPYSEWAQGQVDKIRDILNHARKEHTETVSSRIDSVSEMKDVVGLTKNLFALSKETAQLEAESFILKQEVAVKSEVKQMLDSWVRYEQQAKEEEQAQLTKSVIDKVMKSLTDEKNQKQILADAIAEVEQLVKNKAV